MRDHAAKVIRTNERVSTYRHSMPERAGEYWHAIVDALTESVVLRDAEGSVLFVNTAAQELAGATSSDFVGGKLGSRADRAFGEDGTQLTANDLPAGRVLASGVPVIDQLVGIETFGKGLRWLNASAVPVPIGDVDGRLGVVTTALDVTDRVIAERELRASEERFRAALGSMLDGFVLYRAQRDKSGEIVDLICEYANDATIANGGGPAEEMIGRGMLELFPELREQGLFDQYVQVVETGEPALIENSWYESEHATGAFELRVTKFADGCVLVFRDVTEHRRMATELVRSNEKLTEFAAIAAHDLAEPLRALTGFAELLGGQYGDSLGVDAQQWIANITQGTDRMRGLIEDLLTYARAGATAPSHELVDLNEVAAEARDSLAAILRDTSANVELGKLPVVTGDATHLHQLVQNLLANALKFALPGTPPRVVVDAVQEGTSCRLQVTDFGRGVPQGEEERIFSPFHRAHGDEEPRGSGLGLAICRRVAEQHGGTIWVEPVEGGGSRFCVVLPLGVTT